MRQIEKGPMTSIALILAILSLGLAPAAPALAKEPLYWLKADFPPFQVSQPSSMGPGINDLYLARVIESMPEFEHFSVDANFARMFAMMASEDGYCMDSALKTPEREKMALFSHRFGIVRGQVLITSGLKLDKLQPYRDKAGRIDLDLLVRAPDLTAGRATGRAYGPKVDAALAALAGSGHLVDSGQTPGLFKMLESGRVDYVFGYETEIRYYTYMFDLKESFTAIPVAGLPAYLDTYFACSDKPRGRRAMVRINQFIDQAGLPNPFVVLQGKWLDQAGVDALEKEWEASR